VATRESGSFIGLRSDGVKKRGARRRARESVMTRQRAVLYNKAD
jgi:hypothetical protein